MHVRGPTGRFASPADKPPGLVHTPEGHRPSQAYDASNGETENCGENEVRTQMLEGISSFN